MLQSICDQWPHGVYLVRVPNNEHSPDHTGYVANMAAKRKPTKSQIADRQVMTWAQLAPLIKPAPYQAPTDLMRVQISGRIIECISTQQPISVLVCTKTEDGYALQCDPRVWNTVTAKINRARASGNMNWARQLASLQFQVELAADEQAAVALVGAVKREIHESKQERAEAKRARLNPEGSGSGQLLTAAKWGIRAARMLS